MPQLAHNRSIPVSCPLYLDLGLSTEKKHLQLNSDVREHCSKGMLEMNLLYENLFKNHQYHQFNPLVESFSYYLNQSCRNSDKSISPKSFSIESILSSSPSKDILCNPLTYSEPYHSKNGYYHTPTTEFTRNPNNYLSFSSEDIEATKQPNSDKFATESIGTIPTNEMSLNSCPMEKTMTNLKHYSSLNRKSTKVFKSNLKSINRQSKSKRVRTIFTPEQLERLETEFERQQYMVGTGRHYLASTLNLTEAQVKVWFQNRRIKWRKQHIEGQDKSCNISTEL